MASNCEGHFPALLLIAMDATFRGSDGQTPPLALIVRGWMDGLQPSCRILGPRGCEGKSHMGGLTEAAPRNLSQDRN